MWFLDSAHQIRPKSAKNADNKFVVDQCNIYPPLYIYGIFFTLSHFDIGPS